jgi:hypothetical protein
MMIIGQIQGDYIGVMNVFCYMWIIYLLMDHLPAKWSLEICASLYSSFNLHVPFEGVVFLLSGIFLCSGCINFVCL